MTMRRGGFIFDLDGTLVDSLADIAASGNAILERHGRAPASLADYRRFIGNGIEVLVRRLWGVADDAQTPELVALVDEVRAFYAAHCLDQTRPYDGIPQLLDELRRRDFALAVVSNKPDELTLLVVDRLFEADTFESVAGDRAGVPRKPDPSGAVRAAAFMGVDPVRCAMVGDLVVDVATGRAAGMHTVAVTWGFADAETLAKAGPRHLARRPLDLLEVARTLEHVP